MAYYGNNYYERDYEREVIRDSPRDSYSSYSRVDAEYGRPGYPMGHHNHNMVSEVVCESNAIPSYGHHHHGGAEFVERKEERVIYENDYDPCRRMY